MISISDIPKFLLAFFLVLPLISIVHEAGHVFFAWLMGGKRIKITVGSGKTLFNLGMLEIKQYYFWYGVCIFENIKRKNKFANILIFSGGSFFNLLGVFGVIILVKNELLETGIVTYQFLYFSLYYIFFALFPMPYPDGSYSDGKMILDILKGKEAAVNEWTYRVQWETKGEQWQVLDYNNEFIESFDKEEDAMEKARTVAREKRPSRILKSKGENEREVQNFPKIPL